MTGLPPSWGDHPRVLGGIGVPPAVEAGLERWLGEQALPDCRPQFRRRLLRAAAVAARGCRGMEAPDALQEVLAWVLRHPYQAWCWGQEDRSAGWLVAVLSNKIADARRRREGDRRVTLPDGTRKRVYTKVELYGDPGDLERLLLGSQLPDRPGVIRQAWQPPAPFEVASHWRLALPTVSRVESQARQAALDVLGGRDLNLMVARHVGGFLPRDLAEMLGSSETAIARQLGRLKARMLTAYSENISQQMSESAA